MTPKGRVILAIAALVLGALLIALGTLATDAARGAEARTVGAATITLVVGYVFGDRNGEKRLASALVVANAGGTSDPASELAADIAAPRNPIPEPPAPPAPPVLVVDPLRAELAELVALLRAKEAS